MENRNLSVFLCRYVFRTTIMTGLFFATFAGLPDPAHAAYCTDHNTPAASLLFPFVAFDYNQPYGGMTTVITLTNLSSRAQIVHVDLWTDYALPVLGFNIVLTGYDVETFNIRDILLNGQLPDTRVEQHTQYEGVVQYGPVSGWHSAISDDWLSGVVGEPQNTMNLGGRCTEDMAGYPGNIETIPASLLSFFRDILSRSQTRERSFNDECTRGDNDPPYLPEADPWFTTRSDDDPTWMYITIDVVETCGQGAWDQEQYWTPSSVGGQARYDNVLTGDVYWISPNGVAAAKAVHLEADPQLLLHEQEDSPVTFYARYSSRVGVATDTREPLPTAWALRYFGAGDPYYSPRLRVFKGSTDFLTPFDLTLIPEGHPATGLQASNCYGYTVYNWDENENVITNSNPWGFSPRYVFRNLMPLATQEVPIEQFPFIAENGWMLVVWPPSNYGQPGSPESPDNYQTWMGVVHNLWGDSVYIDGTAMANANCFPEQILPYLTGDTGPEAP